MEDGGFEAWCEIFYGRIYSDLVGAPPPKKLCVPVFCRVFVCFTGVFEKKRRAEDEKTGISGGHGTNGTHAKNGTGEVAGAAS